MGIWTTNIRNAHLAAEGLRAGTVVLFVKDPECSAKWYRDVLGMMESARVSEGPCTNGIFMTFGQAAPIELEPLYED